MALKDLVKIAANLYEEAKKLSYTSNRTILDTLSKTEEYKLAHAILALNREEFKKEVGEAITKQLVEILRLATMVENGHITPGYARIELHNFHKKGLELLSSNSWFSFSSNKDESPIKKLLDGFILKIEEHFNNQDKKIQAAEKKQIEERTAMCLELERLKLELERATQQKAETQLQTEKLEKEQKQILLPEDATKKVTQCLAIEAQFITNFHAMYKTEKTDEDILDAYNKLSNILSTILASDPSADTEKLEKIFSHSFKEQVNLVFSRQSPLSCRYGVLFPNLEPSPKYQFYFYACEILNLLQPTELIKLPRNVHTYNLVLCRTETEAMKEAKAYLLEKRNLKTPELSSSSDTPTLATMQR